MESTKYLIDTNAISDAIIAATALVYNLTLVTHNLSDFRNIANLKLIDLHDL